MGYLILDGKAWDFQIRNILIRITFILTLEYLTSRGQSLVFLICVTFSNSIKMASQSNVGVLFLVLWKDPILLYKMSHFPLEIKVQGTV